MNLDFWSGLATSAALIVAIGSQNAYVLRCGIRREHVLPLVLFCALSDALLISVGILGGGALIAAHPTWLVIARYGGAVFLLVYGVIAARRAWQGEHLEADNSQPASLAVALTACFGFTFFNPHVYLDTVVLLGSIANQRPQAGRWWFGIGACSASVIWFFSLGFGARLLAPWFAKVIAWRILDSIIAVTMWAMAAALLWAQ